MLQTAAKAERLLRAALMANAVFSMLSGALLAIKPAWVASLLVGIPALAIQVVGVGVFIFGISTGLLSRRSPLSLKDAAVVSALDAAWVLASVVLLTGFATLLSTVGWWMVLGVALAVADFALLQALAIRAMRAGLQDPSPA